MHQLKIGERFSMSRVVSPVNFTGGGLVPMIYLVFLTDSPVTLYDLMQFMLGNHGK